MTGGLPFDPTGVAERLMENSRIEGDCLVWTGHSRATNGGYGLICIGRRMWRVHRVAFMLNHGHDIGDQFVLHHCDNPPCFRIEHLRVGSQVDNMADMVARSRQRNGNSRKESCQRGHPFTEANTRLDRSGRRACRACKQDYTREYLRQWRAANRESQRLYWREYRARRKAAP